MEIDALFVKACLKTLQSLFPSVTGSPATEATRAELCVRLFRLFDVKRRTFRRSNHFCASDPECGNGRASSFQADRSVVGEAPGLPLFGEFTFISLQAKHMPSETAAAGEAVC